MAVDTGFGAAVGVGAGGGAGVTPGAFVRVTVLTGPGVGVLVDVISRTGVVVGLTCATGSTVVAGVGARVGDAGGASVSLAPPQVAAKKALNINAKSQRGVIRMSRIIADSLTRSVT